VTTAALTAGTRTVVAKVRDPAGNGATATQELTVELNPSPVALGSAATFSVLAGTSVVNTGTSTLSGNLGISPATAVSGFGPGTFAGTLHAGDGIASAARNALDAAITDASIRAPHTRFTGDLNGRTFNRGVHHTSAAFALTGILTLDARGDPNAVFIFQAGAAFNTAAASAVTLVNGAQASNVFWVVTDAAGLGANSTFAGTLMAGGAITIGDSATVRGQVLTPASVTLANNAFTGIVGAQ
jgi:cytoskeletal protein CcmA (bactofilin family)